MRSKEAHVSCQPLGFERGWATFGARYPATPLPCQAKRCGEGSNSDLWANASADAEVSWLEDSDGGANFTHRQGGMWWGKFLWACTAWGGSHWRRILPRLLIGQPSAGRARTAWLSVSPNRQKELWCLDNALNSAQFDDYDFRIRKFIKPNLMTWLFNNVCKHKYITVVQQIHHL